MNHDKIKRIKPIGDNWTLEQAKAAFNELLSALQEEENVITVVPSARIDYCCECKTDHGYDCPKDKPAENSAPELSLDEMIDRCGNDINLEIRPNITITHKLIGNNPIKSKGPTPTEAVRNLLKEMGK